MHELASYTQPPAGDGAAADALVATLAELATLCTRRLATPAVDHLLAAHRVVVAPRRPVLLRHAPDGPRRRVRPGVTSGFVVLGQMRPNNRATADQRRPGGDDARRARLAPRVAGLRRAANADRRARRASTGSTDVVPRVVRAGALRRPRRRGARAPAGAAARPRLALRAGLPVDLRAHVRDGARRHVPVPRGRRRRPGHAARGRRDHPHRRRRPGRVRDAQRDQRAAPPGGLRAGRGAARCATWGCACAWWSGPWSTRCPRWRRSTWATTWRSSSTAFRCSSATS